MASPTRQQERQQRKKRTGHNASVAPQQAAGKRVVNKSHLCTQDHAYKQAHVQESKSGYVPNSGAEYEGGRIPNLYNMDDIEDDDDYVYSKPHGTSCTI